jgi:hypothetical protein
MAEQESVYLWSTTALTNASVDPAINFAEGQLPGTLNNSNRAEMAALARYVKDTDGSLTTAGSANAYTLTINGRQTPLATGHFLTFKASFTNTAAATLAVTNADAVALGTKAIRGPGDVALAAGQMISGGVYQCRYDTAANSADGAWILLNPYVDGLLANNRVAKTANYTLAATEKGKTVALGGSTHFTLTVSAASGYDTNFAALIINEDSGRGKTLAINGYTSFILWPGQQIMLLNQNNVWQFQMPPVWSCPVGTTWNVNHASGVNSGDGLGTGASAWATIQYAVDQLLAHIYSPKSNIIIQLAAETFTESVTVSSTVGATSGIQINGNSTSTPANSTWQTSGTALLAFDNAFVLLNGIRLVGTGSGNVGLRASKFGFIEVPSSQSGWCGVRGATTTPPNAADLRRHRCAMHVCQCLPDPGHRQASRADRRSAQGQPPYRDGLQGHRHCRPCASGMVTAGPCPAVALSRPQRQFSGDRYTGTAQLSGDVVNAVRSKRRARYLYPTRKRPPVRRQQWRHDIAQGRVSAPARSPESLAGGPPVARPGSAAAGPRCTCSAGSSPR